MSSSHECKHAPSLSYRRFNLCPNFETVLDYETKILCCHDRLVWYKGIALIWEYWGCRGIRAIPFLAAQSLTMSRSYWMISTSVDLQPILFPRQMCWRKVAALRVGRWSCWWICVGQWLILGGHHGEWGLQWIWRYWYTSGIFWWVGRFFASKRPLGLQA